MVAVGGLQVLPDRTLASTPTVDVLVVPGGVGSRREVDNRAVVDWVDLVADEAELVMSICSGARILASAGSLAGLRVTTHHQVAEHLRELEPTAEVDTTRRFVDTGRILTTGGISAGIDGALHVVMRMLGETAALRTASYMEYDWRPSGPEPSRSSVQ